MTGLPHANASETTKPSPSVLIPECTVRADLDEETVAPAAKKLPNHLLFQGFQ